MIKHAKLFLDKFWYPTNYKLFYDFYNQFDSVNCSSCFKKSTKIKWYCHVRCRSHQLLPHVNNF